MLANLNLALKRYRALTQLLNIYTITSQRRMSNKMPFKRPQPNSQRLADELRI